MSAQMREELCCCKRTAQGESCALTREMKEKSSKMFFFFIMSESGFKCFPDYVTERRNSLLHDVLYVNILIKKKKSQPLTFCFPHTSDENDGPVKSL